jgi:hypothetical protein
MAIWGCSSSARCCQPAVAEGFIYADLRSELNTHLAPQVCLLRVLHHCYNLSPFQAHWGRWHCTHFLRLACLFTVHLGSRLSPLFCGVFLPRLLLQAFPLLVAGHVLPLLLSLAQLVYLQLGEGLSLPPLQCLGCPALFATCLFFCYCLLFRFFFLFSLGRGQFVQGAMLIWPRVVWGSTTCRLAHLVVCVFPSCLGAGVWQHRSPPGFSV